MTTAVQKPTRRPHFQAASEIALALVSISIVIGFGRVFNDRSFVVPLLSVVVATHLYLALVRRRGCGIAVSGGVGIAGLVLLCTYLFFASSTRALLPSIDTLTQARDALQTSYNTF